MPRVSICDKVYLDTEGNESNHASPVTASLEFRFTDGTKLMVDEAMVGEGCQKAAFFHGLAQKIGDSYAGVKGNVEDAIENAQTVIERLTGDDWITKGEGLGARPSLVADAVRDALQDVGEEVDDERYKNIREKVKGQEAREGALANPVIKAKYEELRAKAAADRAAKAVEAAEGETLELGEF